MKTIPPHIPVDTANAHAREHASPFVYAGVCVIVGSLSGFVASLAYTAYGPSATPIVSSETRIERVSEIIEERRIKTAQESTASFFTDKIDGALSYGVAITGDGWFVTHASAAKAKRLVIHPKTDGVIEKVVADSASPFVFVKTTVKDARLLEYAQVASLARGTKLAIVLPDTAIPVTLQDTGACITDVCPQEFAHQISYGISVVEQLPQFNVNGAPVITQQGELVGVALRTTAGRVVVIPMASLRSGFESLFGAGAVARPSLAMRAINATRWSVADASGALLQRGMLVLANGGALEIKEGDVITHIERQPIEATSTLFDLMSNVFASGKATITVIRGTETLDIVVPFKK